MNRPFRPKGRTEIIYLFEFQLVLRKCFSENFRGKFSPGQFVNCPYNIKAQNRPFVMNERFSVTLQSNLFRNGDSNWICRKR